MPAPLENQTQHKHAHTHVKRNKESDMDIRRGTHTKDTIHTHTDIHDIHTHTNRSTGPPMSLLLRPPLPARVCVCR